jgi:hypothetical protein
MADEVNLQDEWNAVAKEREQGATNQTPPEPAPPAEGTGGQPSSANAGETPAGSQAPAPQEPADPYAGLHPDIRARLERFDQVAATHTQLVNGLREATGRIGALQSQLERARQAQASAQPTQAQVTSAAKDPEKWAALKKDFPEWGDAISEYVESRAAGLAGKGVSAEDLEQLVAQRTTTVSTELAKKFNENLVTLAHRNWKTEINSPAFGDWVKVQAPAVQQLAQSADPFDAIQMLDLYAEHKKRPAAEVQSDRQRVLAAAVTSKPSGGAATVKSVEDMTPQELWDHEAKQRRARAA